MDKEKISSWWQRVVSKLAKTIGPGYSCFVCNRELENPEYPICKNCMVDMIKIENPVCKKCGEPLTEDNNYCIECRGKDRAFDLAKSCFVYNEASGKVVSDLKYKKKRYIAKFIAEEMFLKLKDFGTMPDIIVPVPITKNRYKKMGFNQSELIAEEIARLSNDTIKVRTDLITRDVDRLPQAGLNMSERMVNLKGVFSVSKVEKLTGKTVVIVDDVFTTGSTISEVALQLAKLKPKAIWALTFAKTPINRKG